MEQAPQVSVDEKKIQCPHCSSNNCFQEEYVVETNSFSSYLCMGCGYTTNTLSVAGTEHITMFEEKCPELFKDIKFHDTDTNFVWYPTVLNFPDLGIIFPDGTTADNWKWRAVPTVPVKEDELEKYPIPNEPGKFYDKKADIGSSKLFDKEQFADACKHLNIIQ